MKSLITLTILFIATSSFAQRANKKSTNYEKRIIGTWYETDNYGFKTDNRGNTTPLTPAATLPRGLCLREFVSVATV